MGIEPTYKVLQTSAWATRLRRRSLGGYRSGPRISSPSVKGRGRACGVVVAVATLASIGAGSERRARSGRPRRHPWRRHRRAHLRRSHARHSRERRCARPGAHAGNRRLLPRRSGADDAVAATPRPPQGRALPAGAPQSRQQLVRPRSTSRCSGNGCRRATWSPRRTTRSATRDAPGGATVSDVANQADDAAFVLDQVLALARKPGPLRGPRRPEAHRSRRPLARRDHHLQPRVQDMLRRPSHPCRRDHERRRGGAAGTTSTRSTRRCSCSTATPTHPDRLTQWGRPRSSGRTRPSTS